MPHIKLNYKVYVQCLSSYPSSHPLQHPHTLFASYTTSQNKSLVRICPCLTSSYLHHGVIVSHASLPVKEHYTHTHTFTSGFPRLPTHISTSPKESFKSLKIWIGCDFQAPRRVDLLVIHFSYPPHTKKNNRTKTSIEAKCRCGLFVNACKDSL